MLNCSIWIDGLIKYDGLWIIMDHYGLYGKDHYTLLHGLLFQQGGVWPNPNHLNRFSKWHRLIVQKSVKGSPSRWGQLRLLGSVAQIWVFIRPMAPSQSASRKAFVFVCLYVCHQQFLKLQILWLSVSFRYGKWVVPLILLLATGDIVTLKCFI